MGSTQSTKRPKGMYLVSNLPDYARRHSPSRHQLVESDRHPLVQNDSLNLCDSSQKHEATLKDIRRKSTRNENNIFELQGNIEHLEHLLLLKNIAVEESIKDNTYNVTKIIELEKKIEDLDHLLYLKNAELEGCGNEKVANEKLVARLEKRIKRLEHSLVLKSSVEESFSGRKAIKLEHKIKRLKNCLASMNAAMEETGTENTTTKATEVKQKNVCLELQVLKNSKADEVKDLISFCHDDMNKMEVDGDADEPEYVERIMGVILVLIFVVSVSIGMHL